MICESVIADGLSYKYAAMQSTSRNKVLHSTVVLALLLCFSCQNEETPNDCVRGKYLGDYCGGKIVQVLDDHRIGSNWKSAFGPEHYINSLVASIDTAAFGSAPVLVSIFSPDSLFYFKYRDGGYPRKEYNNCQPGPWITITFISDRSCAEGTTRPDATL
jgi:hypothetical protein